MDIDDDSDVEELAANISIDQIFRPFPDPDDPNFETIME
jgi:hypothetical protein